MNEPIVRMIAATTSKRILWNLLLFSALFGIWEQAALALPCELQFPNPKSTTSSTIDGTIKGDGFWTDASKSNSGTSYLGEGCFKPFLDNDVNSSILNLDLPKRLYVYSKQDDNNFYLAFDVPDATWQSERKIVDGKLVGGKSLIRGERVIVLLGPTGNELSEQTKKIIVTSKREWADNAPSTWIDIADGSIEDSQCSTTKRFWKPITSKFPLKIGNTKIELEKGKPEFQIGWTTSVERYSVELKIPKSLVGQIGNSETKVAIAVINDLGIKDTVTKIALGTGLSFPKELPVNTTTTEQLLQDFYDITNKCDDEFQKWRQPDKWATVKTPDEPGNPSVIGDVTINDGGRWTGFPLHIYESGDEPWSWRYGSLYWSDDIDYLTCEDGYSESSTGISTVDKYIYYADKPCRFKVKVTLHNSSKDKNQVRNVLVLASNFGVGQNRFEVVDLIEVTVPHKSSDNPEGIGTGITKKGAPDGGFLPKGFGGTPCLRVLVLPVEEKQELSYKKMIEKGYLEQNEYDELYNGYGLNKGSYIAHQNVTSFSDSKVCPSIKCSNTASLDQSIFPLVAGDWTFKLPEVDLGSIGDMGLLSNAYAQAAESHVSSKAPGKADVSHIPSRLIELYGESHIIVSAEVFGSAVTGAGEKPLYNIIEPIGGVAYIIPVHLLMTKYLMLNEPIEFFVGNPRPYPMKMFLSYHTYFPAGYQNTSVNFSWSQQTLAAGQSFMSVGTVKANLPGTQGLQWWQWIALAFVVSLFLPLYLSRLKS